MFGLQPKCLRARNRTFSELLCCSGSGNLETKHLCGHCNDVFLTMHYSSHKVLVITGQTFSEKKLNISLLVFVMRPGSILFQPSWPSSFYFYFYIIRCASLSYYPAVNTSFWTRVCEKTQDISLTRFSGCTSSRLIYRKYITRREAVFASCLPHYRRGN